MPRTLSYARTLVRYLIMGSGERDAPHIYMHVIIFWPGGMPFHVSLSYQINPEVLRESMYDNNVVHRLQHRASLPYNSYTLSRWLVSLYRSTPNPVIGPAWPIKGWLLHAACTVHLDGLHYCAFRISKRFFSLAKLLCCMASLVHQERLRR